MGMANYWEITLMTETLLYKTFVTEIKEIDEKDRSFWAVASTGDKDRGGDIINQEGWDLKNYKRNPIVLWSHDYHNLPVAKAEKIKIEDNKLMFQPKFATQEDYPFADTIFRLYKGGFLRSFSVGFVPKESEPVDDKNPWGGRNINKQELYEISCVNIPAQPNARIKDAVTKGIITENDYTIYTDTMESIIRDCVEDFEDKGSGNGSITDSAWDGSKSRFTVEQLLKAIPPAIAKSVRTKARKEGREITKGECKLPHHEPDGTLNANGVRSAKGRLNQTELPEGVSQEMVLNHLDMHSGQIERWREGKNFYPYTITSTESTHSDGSEIINYIYTWDIKTTSNCEIVSFPTFEAGLKAIIADVELYKNRKELTQLDKEKIQQMIGALQKAISELNTYTYDVVKLKELLDRVRTLQTQ